MSNEEQRRVLEEKFGVEEEVEETPDFVDRLLHNLNRELDAIQEKEAYETALFIIPEHVQDENFLLAFLRASVYNEKSAAQRIVNYWNRKVDLFGTDIAFKPYISLLDFKEKDHAALLKGGLYLLPNRDESGRAIIYSILRNYDNDDETMLRYLWYIVHIAIFQDSDGIMVQKKGFLYVGEGTTDHKIHAFDSISTYERWVKSACRDASSVLPMRVVSFHIFSKSKRAVFMVERALLYFGRSFRLRLNFYVSTEEKKANLALLEICGIRKTIVPKNLGGDYDLGGTRWILERVANELYLAGASQGWEAQYPMAKKLLTLASKHEQGRD